MEVFIVENIYNRDYYAVNTIHENEEIDVFDFLQNLLGILLNDQMDEFGLEFAGDDIITNFDDQITELVDTNISTFNKIIKLQHIVAKYCLKLSQNQ